MSKKLSLVRSLLKEEDEYYSKNTKKKNKAGVHDLSPAGLAAKMTGNAQAGNPKFKRGKIKKEAPAAGSRPGYATGMNTAQMQQQGQARLGSVKDRN